MAVNANTIETYDNLVLREDLQEQYSMVSPEEVPFQTAIGEAPGASQPHHEWPQLSLADVDSNNRVIEGDDAPAVDEGTLATRVSNYTQISDKRVKVSHTSQASEAAAEDVEKLSKQVALKIRELKRDMETMLLSNVAANPGASGTARVCAGMPAWLTTNTYGAAGGTDPTLSGGTTGYPNAIANVGDTPTPGVISETIFNDVIQEIWTNGGNPNIAMVNANNKRVITDNFNGASTRYKDAIDKMLVNAVDIYDSDFGQFSIVPNRFQPTLNAGGSNDNYYVLFLDPEFAGVSFLEQVQQKPLAETGHSRDRLVWCEYTLQVDNEAAHGIYRDTSGTAA